MVYRVYVEKKQGLAHEADALRYEIRHLLQIKSLESVRVLNRYDVEQTEAGLFEECKTKIFSEPQLDTVSDSFDAADATVRKTLAVKADPARTAAYNEGYAIYKKLYPALKVTGL